MLFKTKCIVLLTDQEFFSVNSGYTQCCVFFILGCCRFRLIYSLTSKYTTVNNQTTKKKQTKKTYQCTYTIAYFLLCNFNYKLQKNDPELCEASIEGFGKWNTVVKGQLSDASSNFSKSCCFDSYPCTYC